MSARVAFLIPALNEEQSIGRVLDDLQAAIHRLEVAASIFVVDNGSTDGTATVASARGATVIREPRRGYGQACLAGMASLPPETEIAVFLDADGSDDLADLDSLLQPILRGEADFVVGSRTLLPQEPGVFTPQQKYGNRLATTLMHVFFGAHYTDLGPFRAIRKSSLDSLEMRDTTFGWTIEMQIKAFQRRLRTREAPVRCHRRVGGVSKISGNAGAGIRAGIKIIGTILRYRFSRAR